MANTNRPTGFKPVKHLNGSPYTGAGNIYAVVSGTTLVPGDLVKLTGGASQNGVAEVSGYTNDAAVLGAVVGFVVPKTDPVTGKLSTGSMSLDVPLSVTGGATAAYVFVSDSPDTVYEAQKATFSASDVGTSAGFDITGSVGGAAGTGTSALTITDTVTGVIQVLGLVQRPDNETGAYGKVLCRINNNNYAL